MKTRATMPVALTIAGSDSGGGAGIQADLKTFHALGVFGTSAITAITCQNPSGIRAVLPIPPRIVTQQIASVTAVWPVRAAKTGMLYDAEIIRAVARAMLHPVTLSEAKGLSRSTRGQQTKTEILPLRGSGLRQNAQNDNLLRCGGSLSFRLVVDPVMISTSGVRLLQPAAVRVLQTVLFPLATVVTPNLAEAEVLWRNRIQSLPDLRAAARALADRHGVAFLVKGGHLTGTHQSVDVLWDGSRFHEFSAPRTAGIKTHGTGCVFSAALTAHLALGCGLIEAVGRAKTFVTRAIRTARKIGRYHVLQL